MRADAIPRIETYEEIVTEVMKSSTNKLLYDEFRLHEPKARVDLTISNDDTKLVFASADAKTGQLKLVPFSRCVNIAAEGKAKSLPSSSEVKLAGPKGAKYVAGIVQLKMGKYARGYAKPLTDNIVVPYWLVRRVQDKSKANMQKNTMQCTLTLEDGDEELVQKVSLPIIHNIKDVKQGEELVLYVEPSLQKEMPAQNLALVKKRPAAAPSKPPVSKMQKKPRQKK